MMVAGATDRPRVVVSVQASVDGRITLRRDRLLMDEDAARIWRSLSPPGAQALDDARTAQLESTYQPQAVLEGSGSLVVDTAGALTGLPAAIDHPVDVLYTDLLPEEVAERPGHEKWFTVVDSRGRIGGLGTPTLFDGPEPADGETPTRLRLLAHTEADGALWLRYEVMHNR